VTPAAAEVALVDFGMGNLRSVARALERAGAKPSVTADPSEVLRADRVVLPGVGALGDCMRGLARLGVEEALRERIPIWGSAWVSRCSSRRGRRGMPGAWL
jgi:glutamine amidotransferase